MPLRVIFGVATVLGFFSAFTAFYFVSTFTEKPAAFGLLLTLNLSYWYSWALLTPAILWLSRRFPFDRATWKSAIPVHVVGVFVTTLVHVALVVAVADGHLLVIGESVDTWLVEAQQMFFLNFDWEMMTYWAIVGVSHALRYHYEAQARALSGGAARDPPGRGAAADAAAADAAALPVQHPQHHLGADAPRRRGRRRHDRPAERPAAHVAAALGVQEVALAEELDFLSKYLEIEQTRFRDRLTVVFDVDPDTLDALVPNLLLQPLVENAIRHGIGPRPTPGHIAVRARRRGAMLELEVQDNGVGLSAARLTDFNRGVGLSNTRSRLEHLYGSLHRFEFRQPAEGGLLVVIAIPMATLAGEVGAEDRAVEGVA